MVQFHRNQQALLQAPAPLAHHEAPDLPAARAIVASVLAENRTLLTATESKRFLDAFRIPVVPCEDAESPDEAVAIAERLAYPVAMKILSRDITHKSDVGGVKLGLADAAAVRTAWAEIMASVGREKPDARVDGVTIEPMIAKPHARELMVGIASDRIFGPAISFGAGGIAVEVLRDRAVGLPPLNSVLIDD